MTGRTAGRLGGGYRARHQRRFAEPRAAVQDQRVIATRSDVARDCRKIVPSSDEDLAFLLGECVVLVAFALQCEIGALLDRRDQGDMPVDRRFELALDRRGEVGEIRRVELAILVKGRPCRDEALSGQNAFDLVLERINEGLLLEIAGGGRQCPAVLPAISLMKAVACKPSVAGDGGVNDAPVALPRL